MTSIDSTKNTVEKYYQDMKEKDETIKYQIFPDKVFICHYFKTVKDPILYLRILN